MQIALWLMFRFRHTDSDSLQTDRSIRLESVSRGQTSLAITPPKVRKACVYVVDERRPGPIASLAMFLTRRPIGRASGPSSIRRNQYTVLRLLPLSSAP